MRITHRAINYYFSFDVLLGDANGRAVFAGGALVRGGLCCHKMPHSPRRFKLLVVILRSLATLAKSRSICSFSIKLPAKPLPECKSSMTVFNTMVEDSIFFTA